MRCFEKTVSFLNIYRVVPHENIGTTKGTLIKVQMAAKILIVCKKIKKLTQWRDKK